MQNKISVLHEGVNTELCTPRLWTEYRLPDGRVLNPQTDEIITHVERHFDGYRGFPIFLKAIATIQKRRPNAHVVIVGKSGAGYSGTKQGSIREMIAQSQFDRSRTHFVGYLDYPEYIKLLQVSSAHIYLTFPFVLSWSFMEAMSIACPIVCSNSAPVKELAEDGKDCLMFDFFDHEALADSVDILLNDRDLGCRLGAVARQKIVEQYNVRDLLPLVMQLIRAIAAGENPEQAAQAIRQWNVKWGREQRKWQKSVPLFQAK